MYKAKKIKFLFDKKEIQTIRLQMGMVTGQSTKPLTVKNMKEAHDLLNKHELIAAGIDYFIVRLR